MGASCFARLYIHINGENPNRNTSYTGLLTNIMIDPDWGTLTQGEVNRMNASGYTDSSGALERAKIKFTAEANIHKNENGEEKPLKCLVFMTDGMNNPTSERICEEEWVREYWKYTHSKPSWKYGQITYHQPGRNKIWKWKHHPAGYEEVCEDVTANYRDTRSLEHCNAMKSAGIKIYAIAYDVAPSEKTHAENFMKQCSSGAEYFKSATNSSALEAAFKEIGASIVTEVIRIKR